MKSPQCDLTACMLCRLSYKEWLPAVESNRKNIYFKKGEQIFHEGDAVKGIYFLYQGKVKVHKKWGDKELIIRFAGEGEILGHRGIGKSGVYPISATALENCTLCFVDLSFFEASLKVNPQFTYELVMFLAEELQESEDRMRNLAHMPVKERVICALQYLQHKFGKDAEGFINIYLSRQDVASYAGTTYETVFRILSDLESQSLVKTSGKKIGVVNDALFNMIKSAAE